MSPPFKNCFDLLPSIQPLAMLKLTAPFSCRQLTDSHRRDSGPCAIGLTEPILTLTHQRTLRWHRLYAALIMRSSLVEIAQFQRIA